MNKNFLIVALALAALSAAGAQAQETIISASQCKLASAPAGTPDYQSGLFPLTVTSAGYEVAQDPGAPIVELTPIDPSQLAGWPNYGGHYYSGGNDAWVIITPSDAALPSGVTFKVIKPLETDPFTGARPATYLCTAVNL